MSIYKVLDKCIFSKNLSVLTQCHAQIISKGKQSDDFIRFKFASAYASAGRMRESLLLFTFCNRRVAFLYNSIIKGFASVGRFSTSLTFFRLMLDDGKPIDQHTLPSVLKSCGGISSMLLQRQVHGMVVVHGYASDIANSNALISSYGKLGNLVEAKKVFDAMRERNVVSWTSLIMAFGSYGMFSYAIMLFSRMLEKGVRADSMCFTVVLSVCSHGGMVDEGMKIFRSMEERHGVKPRLQHYTCVVDMLGRAGRMEEALDLIMKKDLSPDKALIGALLGACRIHGYEEVVEEAIAIAKR